MWSSLQHLLPANPAQASGHLLASAQSQHLHPGAAFLRWDFHNRQGGLLQLGRSNPIFSFSGSHAKKSDSTLACASWPEARTACTTFSLSATSCGDCAKDGFLQPLSKSVLLPQTSLQMLGWLPCIFRNFWPPWTARSCGGIGTEGLPLKETAILSWMSIMGALPKGTHQYWLCAKVQLTRAEAYISLLLEAYKSWSLYWPVLGSSPLDITFHWARRRCAFWFSILQPLAATCKWLPSGCKWLLRLSGEYHDFSACSSEENQYFCNAVLRRNNPRLFRE